MGLPVSSPLASESVVSSVADVLIRRQGSSGFGASRATANAIRSLIGGNASREAIAAVLRLTDHDMTAKRSTKHAPRLRGRGVAARAVRDREAVYRAGYVVAAARRLTEAIGGGASLGEALTRERTWYRAHEAARRNRQDAAKAVDAEAAKYGDRLGWISRDDAKTSPECRAAHGSNFSAANPPGIGYPGSVHPHCRCLPGPPWATRSSVDEKTARLRLRGVS